MSECVCVGTYLMVPPLRGSLRFLGAYPRLTPLAKACSALRAGFSLNVVPSLRHYRGALPLSSGGFHRLRGIGVLPAYVGSGAIG